MIVFTVLDCLTNGVNVAVDKVFADADACVVIKFVDVGIDVKTMLFVCGDDGVDC